ncbi:MAG: hypothetical protein KDD22_08480 [Bdellovibrionales bacterium]|nr:hypothetical protein [Bdellovibrionales bacterium]
MASKKINTDDSEGPVWALRVILLFSAILFLQACAVAVPVHQPFAPQSLGKRVARLGINVGSAPVIGPESTSASASTWETDDSSILIGVQGAFGLMEALDLELDAQTSMLSGTSTILGLKYQWLGPSILESTAGDWSSAFRARYIWSSGYKDENENGSGDQALFDHYSVRDLNAKGYSLANGFGYMVAPWFGLYLGGQFVEMKLEYLYTSSGSTNYQNGQRTIQGYGPFLGIHFNSTGSKRRFYFTVEMTKIYMPETYYIKKTWRDGFDTNFGFIFPL